MASFEDALTRQAAAVGLAITSAVSDPTERDRRLAALAADVDKLRAEHRAKQSRR